MTLRIIPLRRAGQARRTVVGSLAVALASALLVLAAPAASAAVASAPSTTAVSNELISLTNASRGDRGLPALTADFRASEIALAWSQNMANTSRLSHNPKVADQVTERVASGWTRIGENVGVGYSAASLHDAFMASSGHRANILGDYNRFGVGTAIDGSGRLWVTLVFVKATVLRPTSTATTGNLPIGNLDVVRVGPGSLEVFGWAADRDVPSDAVTIHLYVDGGWAGSLRADQARGDLAAAMPWAGAYHGWSARLAVSRGAHQVCAFALDASGTNPKLGCRTAQVGGTGFGSLDSITEVPGGYQLNGWAVDPDTSASVGVHVYGNGAFGGWSVAQTERADVASALPAYGTRHGYSIRTKAGHGWTRLCAYGIDAQGGDANRQLACADRFRDARPKGNLDVSRGSQGRVELAGWAVDPDTTSPVTVHVYVDGGWAGTAVANTDRPDVGTAFPGFGDAHGYRVSFAAAPGAHTVCAYAIDAVTAVENPVIGCRVVQVPQ